MEKTTEILGSFSFQDSTDFRNSILKNRKSMKKKVGFVVSVSFYDSPGFDKFKIKMQVVKNRTLVIRELNALMFLLEINVANPYSTFCRSHSFNLSERKVDILRKFFNTPLEGLIYDPIRQPQLHITRNY